MMVDGVEQPTLQVIVLVSLLAWNGGAAPQWGVVELMGDPFLTPR